MDSCGWFRGRAWGWPAVMRVGRGRCTRLPLWRLEILVGIIASSSTFTRRAMLLEAQCRETGSSSPLCPRSRPRSERPPQLSLPTCLPFEDNPCDPRQGGGIGPGVRRRQRLARGVRTSSDHLNIVTTARPRAKPGCRWQRGCRCRLVTLASDVGVPDTSGETQGD